MVECENRVWLNAYHDGELSPAERTDVGTHLRGCPSCVAELAAIRKVSSVFADAAPREPSREQLLQLARSVHAEPSDIRMLLTLFRRTAAAAAVLFAFTLAGYGYLSQRAKNAAHEAMVLNDAATWSQPELAQWMADDLLGRREGR